MKGKAHHSQLRIIGGQWRSRRIDFVEAEGLRPTPDRVRETLFNWLAPVMAGARCLDLFAGSGALGFEAASRGAGEVVMVEYSPAVARQLEMQVNALGAMQVRVINSDARRFLAVAPQAFDIVFLDPPYAEPQLLADSLALLVAGGWLGDHAQVYVESHSNQGLPDLPAGWTWRRQQRAGQVAYGLAARS